MKPSWVVRARAFALLAIAFLFLPAVAMAQVQTLNYPGATATFAKDINFYPGDQIVGTYYDARGVSHGFIYVGGSYAAIDYPGADWSEVTGVNRFGEIVGFYGYNTESFFHGFVRTPGGSFTSIDREGRWNTMPQDIGISGDIVGCVHNPGAMFGWVLHDGTFTSETIGQGWTGYSMYTGINDAGTVVGWYWSANFIRSFVLPFDGERTDFEFPGASNTQAWDVNLAGDVVGWYGPAATSRGFLRRNGSFTEIHVPGATWTRAFGISRAGDIVGAYRDGTGIHGFLLFTNY